MDAEQKVLFDEITGEAAAYYKSVCALDATNQWELNEDSDDIKIYVRQDPASGLRMTRAETTFNIRLSLIKEALQFGSDMLEWDRSLCAYDVLQQVENYKVSCSLSTKITMVTQREAILVDKTIEMEDKSVLIVGKSIYDDSFPADPNYVTADVSLCAWHLIPVENKPEETKIIYILHVDPKGWIPTSLFNLGVQEEAKKVQLLRKYLEDKKTQSCDQEGAAAENKISSSEIPPKEIVV